MTAKEALLIHSTELAAHAMPFDPASPATGFWPARYTRFALRLLVPACVLILWTLASHYQWVAQQILPSPQLVLDSLTDLVVSGELATNLLISLQRISLGSALGGSIGLCIGILFGLSATARRYFEPTLKALFTIPSIGWIPILVLIFGIDETLKILIIAKAVMVPMVMNTSQGIQNIPVKYFEVASVLNLGKKDRLFKLVLPASAPAIFSGIRLAISNAFIALVVVEMLAATEGVGYMMVWGRTLFQLDIVLSGIVIIGCIGYLIDVGLRRTETRLSHQDSAHV